MTRKVGSAALTLSVLWAVVSLVLKGGFGVSLATAGPPSQSNFTRDFQVACLDAQHFLSCEYVALVAEAFVADTNTSEFDQFAADAFPRVLPLSGGPAPVSCDSCVDQVSILETDMATNGTSEDLISTFDQACKKVRTPSAKKNCAAQAASIPFLIDQVLSNDPPATACAFLNCQ
jgi:hypothetical protein